LKTLATRNATRLRCDEGVSGAVVQAGDDDTTGRPMITIESTEAALAAGKESLYGKRVRVVIEKEHGDG